MTTIAPNKKNYEKLPKISPSPKPPEKKYPVFHTEHEVVVHPPIPKEKCPYCNFVNNDGSHKQRGKNFASKEGDEVSITDRGEIYFKTRDDYDFACEGLSIKIPNCPFCNRKLPPEV